MDKKLNSLKYFLSFQSFLLFFIFGLLVIFIPSCRSQTGWQEVSILFFDTVCDIKVYGQPIECQTAIERVRQIFNQYEELFSPEAREFQAAEVQELFKLARKIYDDSGGAFDLTVGILAELWGFRSKAYYLPRPEEINQALRFVGLEKIQQDNGKLFVPEGVLLDWGGIAKGWAVDQATKALQAAGIKRGFINAGGDLFCWGTNPDNRDWRVGIKHPRQPGFLGVLEIRNLAAATSGDYQRYFIVNGVRYHHIFDPKTGWPARGKQSVTVIGPKTAVCDGLATAIFVLRNNEGLLKLYPDYGAIIVSEAGEILFAGKKFPFTPLPP